MFKKGYVKYWGDEFKSLNHFDIVPYEDIVKMYLDTSDKLKETNESFGWNERPVNSEIDKMTPGANWDGYDPKYFSIGPAGEPMTKAKADVISMDMIGLGKDWNSFIYLELPHTLINKYMTHTHDNDDVSVIRAFIETVENSPKGWEPDNYKRIEKEFDKIFPETSTYTDMYETHTCIKWKQDFDIRQYISIKENGLMFPICYNSTKHILRRGTHRAVLLAMTRSDVPIILQYPGLDGDVNKKYTLETPDFFEGGSLTIDVDVQKKELKFSINSKELGKL